MNRNLLYSIKGMFVAAAALVGVAACTDDDHFDVQVSGTAAESVWDNMRNAGQLNDFLSVLEPSGLPKTERTTSAATRRCSTPPTRPSRPATWWRSATSTTR
mgnify:CR=1 FL=1